MSAVGFVTVSDRRSITLRCPLAAAICNSQFLQVKCMHQVHGLTLCVLHDGREVQAKMDAQVLN